MGRAKASLEAAREAFLAGRSAREAALALGVSATTLQRHFQAFRLERSLVSRAEAQDLTLDLLAPLRRLGEEVNARLVAPDRSPADAERDVKLLDLVLRALERLDSMMAAPTPKKASDADARGAKPEAARPARQDLRAELERRFALLRAAATDGGVPGQPEGDGA